MFEDCAQFEIVAVNDVFILLVDLDQGRSVTNDAHRVIETLQQRVPGGIGQRAVYYRDTMGRFDQLIVNRDGAFNGFVPCSAAGQQAHMEAIMKTIQLDQEEK